MATRTIEHVIPTFPAGTSVTPYPRPKTPWSNTGAPPNVTAGSPATVASDGSLTFTGLVPGDYIAYASVSSQDRYLGFTVKEHSTAVNVAATTTLVLAANPRRQWLELRNDSDTKIQVELGSVATAASPIEVPAGESYSRDGYTGPVAAIHEGSGNKSLQVWEG